MSDRLYEQSELTKGQFEFASEYRLEEHPLFEYQIDQWECFPPDAQIHEGGHGVVGEVRVKGGDKEDCRAAIKVYNDDANDDAGAFEIYERELAVRKGLDRIPCVPRLLAWGYFVLSDGTRRPAILTDYISGFNLSELVALNGCGFNAETTFKLIELIGASLKELHKHWRGKGAHRDLSSRNVILHPDGQNAETYKAFLVDFSVASAPGYRDQGVSLPGAPAFAAPELFGGEYHDKSKGFLKKSYYNESPTVDIWSLGTLAYFLRMGKLSSCENDQAPYFDPERTPESRSSRRPSDDWEEIAVFKMKNSLKLLEALETSDMAIGTGDKELDLFIARCTQSDPRKRFQSAAEALESLQASMRSLGFNSAERSLCSLLPDASSSRVEAEVSVVSDSVDETQRHASFKVGGNSHMGPREKNDDAYRIDWDYRFAAVSDGIGGAPDGDIISRVACGGSLESYRAQRDLTAAFKEGNCMATLVSELIDSPDSGATLLLAAWDDAQMRMQFAWVGDSIAYRLRDGRLEQLTRTGRAGQGNALDKAVGYSRELTPDEDWCNIEPGDSFLLCTDGVWETYEKILGRDLLIERLSAKKLPHFIATDIAQEAGRNGYDNATAVVILVEDDPTLPPPQLKH